MLDYVTAINIFDDFTCDYVWWSNDEIEENPTVQLSKQTKYLNCQVTQIYDCDLYYGICIDITLSKQDSTRLQQRKKTN